MPTVIVPAPYRGPTRGEGEVPVEGSTVRACLEAVERSHAGFLAQVVDGSGQVHRFVRLFVNGAPVAGGLDAPLTGSDRLEIVAAIAGG
jgi:sulfur carrier protein ThiS